ncbi:MAG: DNA-directed RNA polymerase subunit alpha [Candidatus Magasanikbacteria bacterium CG10_big_fil_rev_8_21_14_0_10_43_6]|uniref:DNA-directed RNA polymerase subunit alpha n=1 Tax=Candidatus Magasanikbacteria bacterium CG10_big_fil_rev_8_21_14_0_10_43_6 TaxID=1974650 RepID=A0A2M6W1C4_9BACT|nr:MAG: DNA-directed RNA polymerase subunit alpha [Candidatus Magasanikbacteria bacterium CG10_big_fil_rev_8_21_14_0_10_43_6]
MEHIMLPTNVSFEETEKPHVGKLVITPCQQGYGITLGNSLRRVLLASLPGAAVESVKIEGVQHEFSAIDDVEEDMVEVLLNLKQLAVKSHADGPVILKLKKKGKGDITAADFEKNADIEIANPELKIMTVTKADREIDMEVIIGNGIGYIPASEKETKNLDLGTIVADSLYTPIRDIGYDIENTRVGDVTDYEKLTVTIETNGTVSPQEAVHQATKILMDHFALVLDAAQGSGAPVVKDMPASEETPTEDEVDA